MANSPRSPKAEDSRVRRSNDASATRASRSSSADVSRTDRDGTLTTPSDRQQLIRSEFQQEALPSVPEIPGFHTCWLSTTSSYDPIHKRMRMGYVPVRAEEVRGLDSFRMKSGQLEGVVSCNEMALFKIPNDLYLEIMRTFHHDMPMEEEAAIKASLKKGEKDSAGKDLDEVEGFEDLAQRRAPQFAL